MSLIEFIRNNTLGFLIASLTIGLAPFNPPHIVGKIEWILSGAKGMKLMDWLDVVLHGTPWLLLIISITFRIMYRN